jgi:hypothetical protein
MTLVLDLECRVPVFYVGRNGTRHVSIGLEQPADSFARERLLDQAFGAARFDKTVERLRAGRRPVEGLSLAAKDSGGACGISWLAACRRSCLARSRSPKPAVRRELDGGSWKRRCARRKTPGTRQFCSSATPGTEFDIFPPVLHPVRDSDKRRNPEITGDVEHPKPAAGFGQFVSQIADVGIVELTLSVPTWTKSVMTKSNLD